MKRTLRNRHYRQTMRGYVKRVRTAVEAGDQGGAREQLAEAIKRLDQAVTKGILHRRTASRAISRLTIAVNRIPPTRSAPLTVRIDRGGAGSASVLPRVNRSGRGPTG